MFFIAIFKRIHEYGITENRFFIILLGVWIAFNAGFIIFTKYKMIRIVPISLALIAVLSINGPWNVFKISKGQQLHRFETILKYKSEWYGRDIIKIDRFFPSSKLCSDCGFRYQELSLLEREWICPKCGTKHNRDFNAANNIEKEGQRILDIKEKQIGLSSPEFTLAEIGSVDDIVRNNALKSTQSLKQEKNVFNRFG